MVQPLADGCCSELYHISGMVRIRHRASIIITMLQFFKRNARAFSLLLLIGVCFLAAQGSGIRLFSHLFYMLLALLLLSFLWAWSNLHGLDVWRETYANRAHVGEYARERLTLRNRWWLPKLWIELRDHSNLPQHSTGFVASLAGRTRHRWTARTLCTRRGRFRLGPATLVTSDPFDIFRLEQHLNRTSEIIVYPQTVDLPHFTLPDIALPGGRVIHGRTYHVTPNVSTVREYAPGDSFNRIHWRTTARTNRLMVKEFEMDPTADTYIVLDMQERIQVTDTRALAHRASPYNFAVESTEEYAVLAAASLGRHLLAQNRAVGLITWGQQREMLPAERATRQLFKMLETLAALRAYGAHPLAEVLMAESVRFRRNSTLLIITAAPDERWTAALQQLVYQGVRAMVLLVDAQSFGGWRDPEPVLARLNELGVLTYRWQQGQPLPEALRMPVIVGGHARAFPHS